MVRRCVRHADKMSAHPGIVFVMRTRCPRTQGKTPRLFEKLHLDQLCVRKRLDQRCPWSAPRVLGHCYRGGARISCQSHAFPSGHEFSILPAGLSCDGVRGPCWPGPGPEFSKPRASRGILAARTIGVGSNSSARIKFAARTVSTPIPACWHALSAARALSICLSASRPLCIPRDCTYPIPGSGNVTARVRSYASFYRKSRARR